jgi:SnoaL-like domain
MATTEDWAERAAIVDLLNRYATAIDTRNWVLLRSCFTADSKLDYDEEGRFRGIKCDQCGEEIAQWDNADAVTGHFTHSHDGYDHTQHRITNAVVELTGNTAAARSYVHAAFVPSGAPETLLSAYGRYDDILVKSGQEWLISRRVYTNIHDNFPKPSA